ncbi:MAG TPA: DUF1501 domain-containing protein [Tepidisphaeraceae bacterium]
MFLDRAGRVMAADFTANPHGVGRPDKVLVIVQLAGGNDGLNTVIPIRNDDYYRVRPRIGIKKDKALKLTDDFGVHPAATGFKKLYDEGLLAICQCVGYPNFNRSHFRSTDIWSSAMPDRVSHAGWLGRYFDSCCSGEDPGKPNGAKPQAAVKPADPAAAIALTNAPPIALEGEKFIPIAFRNPQALTYQEAQRNGALKSAFEKLNDGEEGMTELGMDDDDHKMARVPKIPYGTEGSLNLAKAETDMFVQRSALNARVYAEQIKSSVARVANKASYPATPLAADLKLVAQMIAAGLPTRVYYVTLGGFDTHSNELPRHEKLMGTLSNALAAFADDLKALGHLDRTTVMTFSEFGRRVAENGSQGTDHGEAAPLFVMGGAVKPGFYGPDPDLRKEKLTRGDVAFKLDFRQIYATMMRDWLKADDVKVLGGRFETLGLFKTV